MALIFKQGIEPLSNSAVRSRQLFSRSTPGRKDQVFLTVLLRYAVVRNNGDSFTPWFVIPAHNHKDCAGRE